jgi:hypothetical protein
VGVPALQLLAALAQTIIIILERFAYLYRATGFKVLLHLGTVVFVHVSIFFVLPLDLGALACFAARPPILPACWSRGSSQLARHHMGLRLLRTVPGRRCRRGVRLFSAGTPLESNPVAVLLYLVFALYFFLSTAQLYHCYPRTPPENSLMSKGYDPPIPLLYRCGVRPPGCMCLFFPLTYLPGGSGTLYDASCVCPSVSDGRCPWGARVGQLAPGAHACVVAAGQDLPGRPAAAGNAQLARLGGCSDQPGPFHVPAAENYAFGGVLEQVRVPLQGTRPRGAGWEDAAGRDAPPLPCPPRPLACLRTVGRIPRALLCADVCVRVCDFVQAPIWKLLFGVLLLVLLVLVILFPAFLFSSLNPTLQNNYLENIEVDICMRAAVAVSAGSCAFV